MINTRKLSFAVFVFCMSCCEAQSSEPHAVNDGVFRDIPNVAALILAAPKDGGAASAEAFGTYSTLSGCQAVRTYYLRINPAKFARPGVDFVCLIDAYDPSPSDTMGVQPARPTASFKSSGNDAKAALDEAVENVLPIAVKVIGIGIGALIILVGVGFVFRGLLQIARGLVRCVRGYRKAGWGGLVAAAKEKLW